MLRGMAGLNMAFERIHPPSSLPDFASSNCTLHFLLLLSPSTPIELERLLNNPYKPLADLTVNGA